MSGLGKRYVAVVEETGETFTLEASCSPTLEQCEQTFRNYHRNVAPFAAHVGALCVDLDLALPVHPPLTDEQLAMHWERVELHAAEQRAKYWPALTGGAVKADEREQMRAVIAAMRPIVEAARSLAEIGFESWTRPHTASSQSRIEGVYRAVLEHRERLGLAMAAWDGAP